MAITDDFDDATNNNALDVLTRWEHLYDGGAGGTSDNVETSTDGGGINVELVQYGFDGGHQTGLWTRTEAAGFPDDQYAQVTKDNDDIGAGPIVRADSNGDGYGIVCGGGLERSYRFDAGVLTALGNTTPTTGAADTIRISAVGTTIERFHNGSSTGSNTDATHAAGVPGIWTNGAGAGNGVLLDDFECTDETAGAEALETSVTASAAGSAVGSATATLATSATGSASGSATGSSVATLAASATSSAAASADGSATATLATSVVGSASAAAVGSSAPPAADLATSVVGSASAVAVGSPTAMLAVAATGSASASAVGFAAAQLGASATGSAAAIAVGSGTTVNNGFEVADFRRSRTVGNLRRLGTPG